MVAGGGCAICLADECSDPAFVDACFHGFCYPCIMLWSESMLAYSWSGDYLRCPLCKAPYESLVHAVTVDMGGSSARFSRYHLLHPHDSSRARLSLTKAQLWRRSIYSHAYQAVASSAVTGTDCTRYLWDWVVRELQALMLDEDVTLVAHLVKGTLEGVLRKSGNKNLSDMARSAAAAAECETVVAPLLEPFLFNNSRRFVKEVLQYLASGLTIDAHDRQLDGHEEQHRTTATTSLLLWTDSDDHDEDYAGYML